MLSFPAAALALAVASAVVDDAPADSAAVAAADSIAVADSVTTDLAAVSVADAVLTADPVAMEEFVAEATADSVELADGEAAAAIGEVSCVHTG
jgi:hypothetical protein